MHGECCDEASTPVYVDRESGDQEPSKPAPDWPLEHWDRLEPGSVGLHSPGSGPVWNRYCMVRIYWDRFLTEFESFEENRCQMDLLSEGVGSSVLARPAQC